MAFAALLAFIFLSWLSVSLLITGVESLSKKEYINVFGCIFVSAIIVGAMYGCLSLAIKK